MEDTLEKGYAEKVPDNELKRSDGKLWYIPHHGVYHPVKQKMRVVFDCAASYHGVSLNDELLQGPDLTNTLVGVLLRFRQRPIALMADIQAMFHQVRVPQQDRDMLRFLWWPVGNLDNPVQEYRMKAHLFGARSSPSCANFALKQTAKDNEKQLDRAVVDTLNHNFYVDDCLQSMSTEKEAIDLAGNLRSACRSGGFRLTKWMSNSRRVIESIPEEERAKEVKTLDLQDSLPIERALGVLWSVESDSFGFKILSKDRPPTRRGILSVVSSIYDPLGFVSPAILPAKRILQDLCKLNITWDEIIPYCHKKLWNQWLMSVPKLASFALPRCFTPNDFGEPVSVQMHHFSDASETGYGTVSYLRLTNQKEDVHCSLVLGKSRVAPLKQVSIPRLELTAATVAVRVNHLLHKELDIKIDNTFYWTDSTTVLQYIHSKTARFKTFVANRVAVIRDGSEPSQWHHVETAQNPADECSRGQTVEKFLKNERWIHGPEFLWQRETEWPTISNKIVGDQLSNDPEVKVSAAVQAKEHEDPIETLLRHFSKWYSLKKAVAWILKVKRVLLERSRLRQKNRHNTDNDGNPSVTGTLTTEEVKNAEDAILRFVQAREFAQEIKNLQDNKRCGRASSSIYRLDPVLKEGVLRVGGRLNRASMPEEAKQPAILPKNHIVSELILQDIHRATGHSGRNYMLSRLRQKYWITGANSSARKIINRCTTCRRRSRKPERQKMADLPDDRITPDEPPFSRVGMDYFGPFHVKVGRSTVKRYGVIFTCLAIRAIHIEKADSLDTTACINAIRRFIARRGQVKIMRSDNGSNLVGANKELRKEIEKLNQAQIHDTLRQKNIKWTFNPPTGSHHGGVWERQIRSVRKVMCSILNQQILTDDHLLTLFCEVEGILNGRPITTVSEDANDLEPLTPNHLLLLKGQPALPPSLSVKNDTYARRRWKQVQYLADLFWRRWTREYLPQLQQRQKWLHPQRNAEVGDIVLVVDDTASRSTWQMGRILQMMPDQKGFVRQVRLKTQTSTLVRPISKVCLLLEADSPSSPSESTLLCVPAPEFSVPLDTAMESLLDDTNLVSTVAAKPQPGPTSAAITRASKPSHAEPDSTNQRFVTSSGRKVKPKQHLDL